MPRRGRKKTKKRVRSGPTKSRKKKTTPKKSTNKKSNRKPKKKRVKKRRNVPMGNARIVKMQKEFLKIEEEILKHMTSRNVGMPRANPKIESRTYFAGPEERMAPIRNSLKKLKR